eukprot:scaffold8050_cov180-Amphora_coffeaeformis.AAC.10
MLSGTVEASTTYKSGRLSEESVGEFAEEEKDSTGTLEAPTPETDSLFDRPKRPLSAYNMFFRDQREILLKSLPISRRQEDIRRGHGKISFQDLAKVVGAKWRDVDPEEKSTYEKIAEEGRKKYRERMKEWKVQQKMKGLPVVKPKKKLKKKVSSPSISREASSALCTFGTLPCVDTDPLPMNNGTGGSRGTLNPPRHTPSFPESFRGLEPRTVSSYSMANDLYQDVPSAMAPYQNNSSSNWGYGGSTEVHAFPQRQKQPAMGNYAAAATNAAFGQFVHSDYPVESDMMVPSYHPVPSHRSSGEFASSGLVNVFDEDVAEPAQLDHDTEPLPSTEQNGSNMHHLADRMGRDCVDLFLGIFGPSQKGN